MSTKEEWQNWRKQTEKKIKEMEETKDYLLKLIKQGSPGEREKTETKQEEHKHFQETDDICPGCYPVVRKKVIEKEFKDADYKCVGCGLPVKKEKSAKEDWKCPGCGTREAIKKDY